MLLFFRHNFPFKLQEENESESEFYLFILFMSQINIHGEFSLK